MRRTNSFTLETENLGKLEVKVYEVRPLDLMEIHKEIQREGLPVGEYERLLPLCCTLTKDQILQLYPSEIQTLVDSFKDANQSFLVPWPTIKKIIEKIGLGDWLANLIQESGLMDRLKTALSSDLQKVSVSLPKEDTVTRKSTGGGSSKSH